MEYEVSNEFVLILSNRWQFEQGGSYESEIYGHHYTKIVIYPEETFRIYYAHLWRNVTDGATVTEWAVNFRQRFYNALAIEYKYSDPFPID